MWRYFQNQLLMRFPLPLFVGRGKWRAIWRRWAPRRQRFNLGSLLRRVPQDAPPDVIGTCNDVDITPTAGQGETGLGETGTKVVKKDILRNREKNLCV